MAVRVERYETAALTRITLDRAAKGNSLSAAMVGEIDAAVDSCHGDGTRVLLIDAAGANFCTGFDLSHLEQEDDDSLLARFVRIELLLQRIYRAPFITVAAAGGKAWGAGADLFAACSHRWLRDDASFAFPGAGFGLVLGTGRLAARVGAIQAETWVVSGTRINAAAALAAGLAGRRLIAESTPDAQPTEVVAALALAESASRLDTATLGAVRAAGAAGGATEDSRDLSRLVQSAARPGLRDRIRAYRAATAGR